MSPSTVVTPGDGRDRAWDIAPTDTAALGLPASPEPSRKALSVTQATTRTWIFKSRSSRSRGAELPAASAHLQDAAGFLRSISSRFPATAPLGTRAKSELMSLLGLIKLMRNYLLNLRSYDGKKSPRKEKKMTQKCTAASQKAREQLVAEMLDGTAARTGGLS